ncbi:MAG: aminotransferase class V-fold PLP-dependent enzyme [Burkholderiaceae bacterium]
MFETALLTEIRNLFCHVDTCPYQGPRVFFENAGGALTLKSVVEVSAQFAAIPDNQGRDNPAAHALVRIIEASKADTRLFLGAATGQIFVGESGTEMLFRLARTAIVAAPAGGRVLGSTLEHPATRSACSQWAEFAGREHVLVPHNLETASVSADDYRPYITPDTRVATIIHTSPVSGMGVDVAAIAAAIRAVAPECYIIVDGVQHAAHGGLDIDSYDIDGYAISPYKVFSRHGYGMAWVSDRMSALSHERLNGSAATQWELGTRDTGAYATFSSVVAYFEWLGSHFTNSADRREKIVAAGEAIHAHEAALVNAMLHGTDGRPGLAEIPGVGIIGGIDNPLREGLVAMTIEGMPSAEVVSALSAAGVRTHVRKNDYFSGNILDPIGLESCIRVSMCHYNSPAEVAQFLSAVNEIAATAKAGVH